MTSVPVKQITSHSSVRHVRPRRDFAAMEERRMRAADLFEQGMIPAEIARHRAGALALLDGSPCAARRGAAARTKRGRALVATARGESDDEGDRRAIRAVEQ